MPRGDRAEKQSLSVQTRKLWTGRSIASARRGQRAQKADTREVLALVMLIHRTFIIRIRPGRLQDTPGMNLCLLLWHSKMRLMS